MHCADGHKTCFPSPLLPLATAFFRILRGLPAVLRAGEVSLDLQRQESSVTRLLDLFFAKKALKDAVQKFGVGHPCFLCRLF